MKILVIEDELEIANFLMRGLKYERYQVELVTDGKEGLDRILNEYFDMVILDLLLPSMGGEEVLKQVRAHRITTPIIILTAIEDVENKTKLLNAGADDYLAKPFSFVELAARIKSVLRRTHSQSQPSEELKVGDLKLIPSMRRVMRGNKIIKLRLKEYSLLEYLMAHTNEVISRSRLMEKVWDYNADLFSNTVDSHISLLRRKINKDFKNKLIETIHGVGYILRDE